MTAIATAPVVEQRRDRRTWSLRTSFWAVVAAQVLLLAASNFPTPLFPIYERQYGFSSGMVTLLFGVYVVALIPSMLTLGRLTDRIGRRPSLVAGIAITAVSSLAFASARNVGWLFAGEVLYGIAGGLVMSSASVAIRELHPKQNVASGALAATLAAAAGLTLGPLVSGFLASVSPWPTVAPYALDIAVAITLAVVLLRIPETKPNHPAPARRPPALHVPTEIRGAFISTALAGGAAWMLTGWVFGLSPSFLHEELNVHITQPVVSGLFAALAVFSNAVGQFTFRRRGDVRSLRVALVVMVSGMAVIAASTLVDSLALALVGAVVAGGGAGVVQMSTMGTILRIAPAHARGGVTSAFLTVGYVGLSLPVIVAGLSADRFGLGVVTGWYLLALVAVVAVAVGIAHHAAEPTEAIDPAPTHEAAAANVACLATS
jgi:MFS family permease